MTVRLDETWQQGAAIKINATRMESAEVLHFSTTTKGDDFPILYGQGLSSRQAIVHGDDVAIHKYQVSCHLFPPRCLFEIIPLTLSTQTVGVVLPDAGFEVQG